MALGGSLIGALRVTLGIDTANFEDGTRRARDTARREVTQIQKSLDSLRSGLTNLGLGATAVAFGAAAMKALDYSDAIADLSDRTGASTKLIQEFRYAAQMSGSSVETADDALGKFTRTLGLAQSGSQTQAKLFRDLGVTSTDMDTAFRQTLDGLQKLPSISERNATAMQLFGRSAATLTQMMGEGSEGFDQLASAAQKLGIVIDEDVLRQAGAVNDKLDAMKMILDAQFASGIANNAQALVDLADSFMTVANSALASVSAIRGWAQIWKTEGPMAALKATGDEAIAVTTRQGRANRAEQQARAAEANVGKQQTMYDRSGGRVGNPTVAKANAQRARAEAARVLRAETEAIVAQRRAARGAQSGAGTGGTIPLPTASAGKKTPAPKAERDRTAEYQERFERDLEQLNDQELALRAQMATETGERARFERDRLESEQASYNADVDKRVKEGELSQLQADQLKLERASIADKEKGLLFRQLEDDIAREELDIRREGLSIQSDLLRGEAQNARSAAERRAIELKILANQYELERLSLENVRDSKTASDAQKELARLRLGELDRLKGQDTRNIERATLGPLADYMDRMPKSVDELNEAYQRVAVDGLKSLEDRLASSAAAALGLKGELGGIVTELIRISIQKSMGGGDIFSVIGSVLGIVSGAGRITNASAGAGFNSMADSLALPKLATGGSFNVGGMPGIDRNVLQINGVGRARVSANERVTITPANDRGGGSGVAMIVPSPYFDVVVDGRVQRGAAPIAASASAGAVQGARRVNNRQASRRLA